MKIRLHEIPEDGKSFSWSRETGELNHVLADLIGQEDYRCEFFVRPLNSRDFALTGLIQTSAPEACSRCGDAFKFTVRTDLNEILIPHQGMDRTGRYSRVNHLSESEESGPSVSEYAVDHTFDMGEFVHEQIAIALPFNPAPEETAGGDCSLCGIKVRGRSFGYDEEMPTEKPNPFAALKGFKVQ